MKFKNLLKEIALRELGETTEGYSLGNVKLMRHDPSNNEFKCKVKFNTENYTYKVICRTVWQMDKRFGDMLEVEFKTESGGIDKTDKGNQFKVMATVMEAAKKCWKIGKQKGIELRGLKYIPAGDKDTQKAKLYRTFIKKQFPTAQIETSYGTWRVYPEANTVVEQKSLRELGETTDHYNLRLKNKDVEGPEGRVKLMWEFATENYEYKVRMREKFSNPVLAIDFDTKESGARVTQEGNQFKVTATVIEAAVRTWKMLEGKNTGVEGFKFNPVSKASVDKDIGDVTQREKLYRTFIKKQFPNVEMERGSGGTVYVYPNKME